ncbi:hypothetical protein [Idiomarina xiamenensis]|uniref:Uncharacterized protein n=1 Tax=Idiomarina xiamenensis 10-D-4 TaxID=740709 RepID=K2JQN9_9GAMM|nr:hypothetical protein [Idiomarina xiamenensis]EKE77603.1 hypothetical protein A10D4_13486 [Idiomarina xiamenensis 10-D-4]
MYFDHLGLKYWQGTIHAISGGVGFGGIAGGATLKSDCNSNGIGFIANVRFHGFGATAGFPWGASASPITLYSPFNDTNPTDLEGAFVYGGSSIIVLAGYNASTVQLGETTALTSGAAFGADVSFGYFRGQSSLTSFTSFKCGCKE